MILVGIICTQNKLARMRAKMFFCYIKIIYIFSFRFQFDFAFNHIFPFAFYSYCWLITTRVLAKNVYIVVLSI